MFDAAQTNQNSLILGSRFIGNKQRENIYLRTFLANKGMSLFFSFVNFYKVTDVATCYKLMPSKFFINTLVIITLALGREASHTQDRIKFFMFTYSIHNSFLNHCITRISPPSTNVKFFRSRCNRR